MKTLDRKSTKIFVIIAIIIFAAILGFSYLNRSLDSSAPADESQSSSQYCDKYLEFDEQVAVLEYTEQLEELKILTKTPDFPNELENQYETIIVAYEQYLDGDDVLENEAANLAAYEDIAIHARDNCGLYERN